MSGSAPERCRVLVIAHDAMLYGAQRSLLDILKHIDRKRFVPLVAIPSSGPFTQALGEAGIPFECGRVQRWIFFPKPMTWRAILRRPWRRLNHPDFLALVSWLTLPLRVALLAWSVRRKRIGLVYTNTATVLDGAIAARLCGIPHVWHLRESVTGNPDLASPLPVGWFAGFALRFSASVIVNSDALAKTLFGAMLPPQAKVIHNGIDLHGFAATTPPPALPPLPGKVRLAAICGTMQERKDILTYIRAAARLRNRHPDLHHLLIGRGDGVYGSLIELEIVRLGMTDRIHRLGYRDDVPALLSRIDILVSSAVVEPFGRTLIEAMALGKPVVATRSGGPQEIVVDGECGFLVDVGDDAAIAERMARLLDDEALCAAIGQAARRRVRGHFDLAACVNRIEDIFAAALATGPET